MRILLASHDPALPTGYARVVRELAKALAAAGHDLVICALSHTGATIGFRIIPWPTIDSLAPLADAIESVHPDLLITIGDPWMFIGLPDLPERRGVKWLAYFPVDGYPLPKSWKRWIAAADRAVVFCKWTADVVLRETGVAADIVYHGVDTQAFAPMDKSHAKARVGVAGAFVVGCVAVNQQRKNLPALVKSFADFARDKPDAILYLHTQIDGYWDIEELVERFGVNDKTRATLNLDPQRGVNDQTLATIYNAFDVFVLPTMAEGFGLPILESQACGVPALATDFSSCSELLADERLRLKVDRTIIMARNFDQAIVSEDDITVKLNWLYGDRTEFARQSAKALEFAKTFEWTQMSRRLLRIVDEVASV